MRSNRRSVALSAFLLAGAIVGSLAQPASASPPTVPQTYVEGSDPAAALYNPLVVNQINLSMPPSTITGLTSPNVNSDNEGAYLPATMSAVVNGKAYGPMAVGVHLKGAWGSWRDINGKSGFKVKIDFVDKNARFFGVSKLTLNNMVQDPSFLHETMAYRIFRAVGIAAPRTGFANVTVNGVNYGLHLNLETFDTELLARFNVKPQHIYKAGVPSFADLAQGQEPGFAVGFGKADDKADLTSLIAANGANPQTDWFTRVSQVADLKEMTLDWATELFTGHWDGYVHNRNNYYLVSDSAGRFIMLPWGTDQSFYGGVDYYDNEGLMFRQCLLSKPCLALYQQALAKVVHTTNALNILPMTEAVAAAISSTALADTRKEFGNDQIPGYQAGARNILQSQLTNALTMIVPFDTEMATFGNADYGLAAPNSLLFVPASAKSIQIQGNPFSPTAVSSHPRMLLHAGLNTATIVISNQAGNNSQTFLVKVYRLSAKAISKTFAFVASSSHLTPKSLDALGVMSDKLANCQEIKVELLFGQAKLSYKSAIALAKRRANELNARLTALSVRPVRITYALSPKVSGDQVTVNLKYQG